VGMLAARGSARLEDVTEEPRWTMDLAFDAAVGRGTPDAVRWRPGRRSRIPEPMRGFDVPIEPSVTVTRRGRTARGSSLGISRRAKLIVTAAACLALTLGWTEAGVAAGLSRGINATDGLAAAQPPAPTTMTPSIPPPGGGEDPVSSPSDYQPSEACPPGSTQNCFYFGYWKGSGQGPGGVNLPCNGGANYTNLPANGFMRSFANNCSVRVWVKSPYRNMCVNPGAHSPSFFIEVYDVQITSNAAACPPGMNWPGEVNWAFANWNGSYNFGNDCTDFVSRAEHVGGDDPLVPGPNPLVAQFWWFLSDANYSNSWSVAQDLAYHLNDNGSLFLSYAYEAEPGDVIFANWTGGGVGGPWNGIDHVAVITKVVDGQIWMTQHSPSQPAEPLSGWQQGHPHLVIWIAVPALG
jgi:hypothetical protein